MLNMSDYAKYLGFLLLNQRGGVHMIVSYQKPPTSPSETISLGDAAVTFKKNQLYSSSFLVQWYEEKLNTDYIILIEDEQFHICTLGWIVASVL